MIARLDERFRPSMILSRFESYPKLASLLYLLGHHVRCPMNRHDNALEVTEATLLGTKRLMMATEVLLRVMSPQVKRKALFVVRGHPGGTGPHLVRSLAQTITAHSRIYGTVESGTGWTRSVFMNDVHSRECVRVPIRYTKHLGILADRAHIASVVLANHLLNSKCNKVILWDPLFSAVDAIEISSTCSVPVDVSIIDPGTITTFNAAVSEVAGHVRSGIGLTGLPYQLARLLVFHLRVGPPANTFALSSTTTKKAA
jgi:hypothetical protein